MIKIKEVLTKKEQKEFVNFPLELYKGNPYYVPCLYSDEMAIFKDDYYYNDQSKSIFFLAYMENKIVGRIQGIIQFNANKKYNQKRVRFTRFDSINNQDVANALFKAVENWAKENQMDEIVGPLGYSDLEREGLLIEGFDQLSTFCEQYSYSYYQHLIENYKFEKEVDWLERRLFLPEEINPKIEEVSKKMLKKYNLHHGEAKNTKDFLNKYGEQFFDILDKTYDELYQTVPLTDKVRKNLIKSFNLIINLDYVGVIVDENDKVVCFGLCFPSIAKEVNRCKGKLNLISILRILKTIKKPETIELALIGVIPEYQNKGISTAILDRLNKMLQNKNVKYAETNLNLEDNHSVQNQWKHFDSVIHKRRRCYIKKID